MKTKVQIQKGKQYKITPYDDDCAFKPDEVVTVREVVKWSHGYEPLYLCANKDGDVSYCLKIEMEEL